MKAPASPLVVFGGGGHGKVVADILMISGETVVGFVDDELEDGTLVLGLPVLGSFAWLSGRRARVALGIGDNRARAAIADRCVAAGAELATALHPRAVIAPSARIAPGAVVMALAVVNPDAVVHEGAIVNTGAIVEHDCRVGRFAHLSPNAAMGGAATIGDFAHVGIGAAILPRRTVGARAIVGAGAVVTRDVEGQTVFAGVPARIVRRLPDA